MGIIKPMLLCVNTIKAVLAHQPLSIYGHLVVDHRKHDDEVLQSDRRTSSVPERGHILPLPLRTKNAIK